VDQVAWSSGGITAEKSVASNPDPQARYASNDGTNVEHARDGGRAIEIETARNKA
jgi:hypothetical protein